MRSLDTRNPGRPGTGGAGRDGFIQNQQYYAAETKEEGFGITLHLYSRNRSEIDELSTSGAIGVQAKDEKVVVVVLDNKNVLRSVTSDSPRQKAASVELNVERSRIAHSESPSFIEVITVETAVHWSLSG